MTNAERIQLYRKIVKKIHAKRGRWTQKDDDNVAALFGLPKGTVHLRASSYAAQQQIAKMGGAR